MRYSIKHIFPLTLLTIASPQILALEVTKDMCVEALNELGLPTDSYELKESWGTTKHIFPNKTECYEADDSIFIKSGRKVYAEEGYFGPETLEARDKILSIKREKRRTLRDEMDEKIDIAKNEFREAEKQLNSEIADQLKLVKQNEVPTAIADGLLADRKKREIKAKEAEQRKAEKLAEREKRKAERAAEKAEKLAQKRADEAENIRKGFHCLSSLNGQHRHVVATVKKLLNDPKSFEHDETRVAPVSKGTHQFVMRYRAKNGFGGLIIGEATGSYGNDDCSDIKFDKFE